MTKTLGRKPKDVPMQQLCTMLPIDLRLRVELRLLDPVTQRVKHGAWSLLLQSLLYEWLQKQESGKAENDVAVPPPSA